MQSLHFVLLHSLLIPLSHTLVYILSVLSVLLGFGLLRKNLNIPSLIHQPESCSSLWMMFSPKLNCVVPQGPIFQLLVFLIYNNDLPQSLPENLIFMLMIHVFSTKTKTARLKVF